MTTMVDPTWVQQVFQGFQDNAAPATATAISAATNTNFTRRASTTWQLRFRIAQTTATANQNNAVAFKLRVQINGTGGYSDVPAQGATGVKIRYADSGNLADGDNIATGDFRLGTGTGTAVAGKCNEAGNTDTITFPIAGSASYSELVFTLEWGPDVAHLDTFEFRVYLSTDVALNTYTVTPTVRYNSTSAPIAVEHTLIAAGGGDFTSITSWESGQQRDLVAMDERAILNCQAGSVTESWRISGWTTDIDRYCLIRAAIGHETGGLASGGYTTTNNTSAATVLEPANHYWLDGIVIANSSTGNCCSFNNTQSGGKTFRISNCIMPDGARGIATTATDATAVILAWNNLIYGQTNECILQNASANTIHAYNNALIGGTYGIRNVAGTVRPKNNIAQDNSTAGYNGSMTDSATNISEDATSPETGLRNISLTFVNAGTDYHLADTDTAAIDAGTDLSADATIAFDYDFEGDTRGASWDIGADERLVAAAGGIRSGLLLMGVGH